MRSLVLILLMGCLSNTCFATPLTYAFEADFESGGQFSGTFGYDTDGPITGQIGFFDISSAFPGLYSGPAPASIFGGSEFVLEGGDFSFQIAFLFGGIALSDPLRLDEFDPALTFGNLGSDDFVIIALSLVEDVPEPTTFGLFALGLALLGFKNRPRPSH